MMTVDPKIRITVPQILLHPWLRDINMRREFNRLISDNNENNGNNETNKINENNENIPPSNVYHKRPRLF